ncbi:hypothetical protein A2U01_0052508 [Trifolium medium]|uniref:Uncharacterized protein n=1 Tax=Trifolium medium TaxID=97028 RepID=A0A392R617_9FABA|nr:hypothetical protein [Trifolium medium]
MDQHLPKAFLDKERKDTQPEAEKGTILQQDIKPPPPFTVAAMTGTNPNGKSPNGNQHVRVRWCRNREMVDRTTNSRGYMATMA